MRSARRLNDDKEFATDAMKTVKFVPQYSADPDIKQEVRNPLSLKPEMRTALTDYMKAAKK